MRIDVLTIFPDLIESFSSTAILGSAVRSATLEINVHDVRDFTQDKHRKVDDEPFGGGPGMVMKVEPFDNALKALGPSHVIAMTPSGTPLNQSRVRELAERSRITILCGRYEGIDERVHEHLVDEEISVGDYILAGGETAAMILIDAIARLIPGVVGDPTSLAQESFETGMLDYPHYTRPASYNGWDVPQVLLSGNHEAVEKWRRDEALNRTQQRRPDLLD